MGALVFINRKDNILEVVDGQQRLTTIAIMIHSVIKLINYLVENEIVDCTDIGLFGYDSAREGISGSSSETGFGVDCRPVGIWIRIAGCG